MSETDVDLSIIVPVYNSAEYLPECLDSLLSATSRVVAEVILVDDGSTDGSGEICDKYAILNPTVFKVVHKPNGGSASARQAGWNIAVGRYITVCDSDDTVEPDIYLQLLNTARRHNADIVICDFTFFYPDGKTKRIGFKLQNLVDQSDLMKKSLECNLYNSSCNKLFKRSIFTQNKLEWTGGINLGEDGLMWTRILTLPDLNVVYVSESLYNYRRRQGENTYTNRITADKWRELKQVHDLRKQLVPDKILKDSASDVVFAGLRGNEIPQNELNCFIDENIHIRSLWPIWPIRPKRIVATFAKIFGVGIAQYIVKQLYKFIYR